MPLCNQCAQSRWADRWWLLIIIKREKNLTSQPCQFSDVKSFCVLFWMHVVWWRWMLSGWVWILPHGDGFWKSSVS
jgi:hypothetical protein